MPLPSSGFTFSISGIFLPFNTLARSNHTGMSQPNSPITVEPLADVTGLEVRDPVEQLQFELYTAESVTPTTCDIDSFFFPVGRGVQITTSELILPAVVSVFVRDGAGEMVTEVEHLEEESLPRGSYVVELSTQVKSYLEVEGPVDITVDAFEIRFSFDEPAAIDLGFRSRHSRPAATVTTTSEPDDIMRAISTFGSALKTTSPERSFPTLRGHPPELELGDELDIPEGISPPDTGITIAVPRLYDTIYPVAPLAYYLGAEVVPGSTPKLTTNSGFEYEFAYPAGFEEDVARVLKQVFLLDCVTRTEGLYQIDLYERNELEQALAFDWGALYEQSLAERVETYLSVPYETISEYVPKWRLTAHVEPTVSTAEQLPFVVDDLAVVRTRSPAQQTVSAAATGFTRNSSGGEVLMRSASQPTHRSTTDTTTTETNYVQFEAADSIEQAWIGDGIPIGASKLIPEAFQNRLDREVATGDIDITVVVNDARMDEERDLVSQVYGEREDLPFDVTIKHDLTTEELHETLQEGCNFLHYIGHIDDGGFECSDGMLDTASLETTDVEAFLLNACSSYQQGISLVESGAIGGIVTLTDIPNTGAIKMGELIARLLNIGFPLRAALTIAREDSVLGGQYIVVGDGGMTVTQSLSQNPNLLEISLSDELDSLSILTFSTDNFGLGAMYIPYVGDNKTYFLSSGKIPSFQVSRQELLDFLDLEHVPVRTDNGSLSWSSDWLEQN